MNPYNGMDELSQPSSSWFCILVESLQFILKKMQLKELHKQHPYVGLPIFINYYKRNLQLSNNVLKHTAITIIKYAMHVMYILRIKY